MYNKNSAQNHGGKYIMVCAMSVWRKTRMERGDQVRNSPTKAAKKGQPIGLLQSKMLFIPPFRIGLLRKQVSRPLAKIQRFGQFTCSTNLTTSLSIGTI